MSAASPANLAKRTCANQLNTQYIAGMRDAKGRPLDGSKTCKVHLSPNVPANKFWAFTRYNVQTRSMLQTNQRFPEITSATGDVKRNKDGLYGVTSGLNYPRRKTVIGYKRSLTKVDTCLFRLYGSEQGWFDKAWRPSEIELAN